MEIKKANNADAVSYRRPALGVLGLKVLLLLRPILPFSVYKFLYDSAFSFYRGLVRWSYLVRGLAGSVTHWRRTRLVFDSMSYSLVGWRGLEETYNAVVAVHGEKIPGAIVECGVAQGGSALLMARVVAGENMSREIWLFDSFEGLPEPTADDYEGGVTGRHVRPLPKGSCLGTTEQVSELMFDRFRLSRKNVTLVKGWFQDTLNVTREKIGGIAVLRLDGDWYESTKCCFEQLYDQVAPSGFVILDDYHSCFGCQKATDEFMRSKGIVAALQADGRGGAFFRKPPTSLGSDNVR